MGKLISKLFLIASYFIMMESCAHSVKISHLYKYNVISNSFYQTYENDSLRISIDFSGVHKYQNISSLKKISVENDIIKSLNQVANINNSSLIFYSKSRLSKYGNIYYGFLIKKKYYRGNKSMFTEYENSKKNKFNISKLQMYKHSINIISVIPLLNSYVVFINSLPLGVRVSLHDTFELDSLYLTANTYAEISSVLSDSIFDKNAYLKNTLSSFINQNLYDKSSYTKPLKKLLEIDIDSFEQLKSFYYQVILTRISFLDNLDSMNEIKKDYLEYLKQGHQKTIPDIKETVLIGCNVFDSLVKIAKSHKVIMVNESHYDFRHRYFLHTALDSLYAAGFRHLCIEDYAQYDKITSNYPKRTDGFYIMEPFMAELIRKAKDLGFTIHPYEDTTTAMLNFNTEIEKREFTQAKNLSALYKLDSNSKWIIYAGYEHINKKSFMNIYKSCAQYFLELSGVKPYCINQTYFSSLSNTNDYLYDKPRGYYVVDPASSIYLENQADLYVINNIYNNPWIEPIVFKKNYSLYSFIPDKDFSGKKYIYVYSKLEYLQMGHLAIPIYIGEVSKNSIPKLKLPVRDYIATITNDEDEIFTECKTIVSQEK